MTLRQRRYEKGMTQMELAIAANVEQSSISHYEQGHWKPNPKTAKKLADVLGCTVGELMKGFDEA